MPRFGQGIPSATLPAQFSILHHPSCLFITSIPGLGFSSILFAFASSKSTFRVGLFVHLLVDLLRFAESILFVCFLPFVSFVFRIRPPTNHPLASLQRLPPLLRISSSSRASRSFFQRLRSAPFLPAKLDLSPRRASTRPIGPLCRSWFGQLLHFDSGIGVYSRGKTGIIASSLYELAGCCQK